MPEVLRMGTPWIEFGERVVVADSFEGPPGDLAGRATTIGARHWRREIGRGKVRVAGDGSARVEGSVEAPIPGRTAYTVPWDDSAFADVAVTITPPGTARGEREHGVSGVLFWQDDDNYVTVNTWVADAYDGSSISCFFQVDGFEDLYDAIWTNVGRRVRWGAPTRLRLVFDGSRYAVLVDGVPVLYRALTDVYPDYPSFRINRVGLLANWEWGRDTGSEFRDFVAMARRPERRGRAPSWS
jgi:hypothetical protein